ASAVKYGGMVECSSRMAFWSAFFNSGRFVIDCVRSLSMIINPCCPRRSGFARRLVTNEIAADFESFGSELWRRSFGGNYRPRLGCCGHGGGWGSLRLAVGAHRAQPFKEKRPLSSGQIAGNRHVAWMFDGKLKRPYDVSRETGDTVVIIEVHHGMRCRE